MTGELIAFDAEDGGVVTFVPLLTKLAGLVEIPGEKVYGDSETDDPEVGECERGVLTSEILLIGR